MGNNPFACLVALERGEGKTGRSAIATKVDGPCPNGETNMARQWNIRSSMRDHVYLKPKATLSALQKKYLWQNPAAGATIGPLLQALVNAMYLWQDCNNENPLSNRIAATFRCIRSIKVCDWYV